MLPSNPESRRTDDSLRNVVLIHEDLLRNAGPALTANINYRRLGQFRVAVFGTFFVSLFLDHIRRVVGGCAKKKVVWVNTRWCIAALIRIRGLIQNRSV